MSETAVTSFVLRFVQISPPDPATDPGWHGYIRHVQSDEESRFTTIEDALTFIAAYVTIDWSQPTWPEETLSAHAPDSDS